jgi:hypothetical protein
MDSDSLTSEVQFDWRRRQIGRPGKEDRAMANIPRIKTIHKNSFWGFRHIRTAGLAGIVCGANVRPILLEGGGSCKEAET